jgi:hypothetical protein
MKFRMKVSLGTGRYFWNWSGATGGWFKGRTAKPEANDEGMAQCTACSPKRDKCFAICIAAWSAPDRGIAAPCRESRPINPPEIIQAKTKTPPPRREAAFVQS